MIRAKRWIALAAQPLTQGSTMPQAKLMLDYVYEHAEQRKDQVFLTQPTGGGRVVDYTWGRMMDQARRMASHLKAQGFASGSRVAISSKNCAHFFMAELAIWMAGHTTVALYPNETIQTLRFVLEHSGASLLFVGKMDNWSDLAQAIPAGLPCIALPLAPPNNCAAWETLTATMDPIAGRPIRDGSDIAMILYTSGSTGQPKGVMHSFARVTRVSEEIVKTANEQMGGPNHVSRVLSYLPLAHVFERAYIECAQYVMGHGHVYFAESLETFQQDLQRARPTFFLSVPRLWLKFQLGVFGKMPEKKLDRLLRIPLIGKIVGRKVLSGLGLDEVVVAGSGSAPIVPSLIEWYRRLGLNLLEGYGMTEDFGYSFVSSEERRAYGHVGECRAGVSVRLEEDGEILIRSPGQLVGYYKRPDLDAAAITADGFFRTGDLGVLSEDGLLKITGRKKEIFKTSKGKYIAPAPIENRINENSLVEQSLVSGAGQPSAYALVMLAQDPRKSGNGAELGKVEGELKALLNSVNAAVADFERLHMIVVVSEPWSVENEFLTPTLKVKRARVEAAVAPRVDGWYAEKRPVLWA
jgi:long-chain acyl-CoA synthetase